MLHAVTTPESSLAPLATGASTPLPAPSAASALGAEVRPAVRVVQADKVASVAGRAGLGADLKLALASYAPRSGDLIAVRILSENPRYDRLELTSGRQAKMSLGDVLVGALGARRALRGYVGDVPGTVTVGDELALLNMGGVLGRCTGFNHEVGAPVRVEYLGAVLGDDGDIANIADFALPTRDIPAGAPPVVAVAGSCMHAGKTRVAAELVKRFKAAGYRVAAAKTSGVACLRDTLDMRDNGAFRTLSFLDLGLPSTVELTDLSWVARSLIAHLTDGEPDVIVVELGDGILGGYNVGSILDDVQVRGVLAGLAFCAGDFVSAWGGVELLKRRGLVPDVIAGAVTDSQMGVDFVATELGLPAANAIVDGAKLFSLMKAKLPPRGEQE